MKLSFSFIIPVYNRPDEIRELLDSLAVQTYPEVFEIVIVEDGSTVPSERIIENFKDKHVKAKPHPANRSHAKQPHIEQPQTIPSGNNNRFTIKYLKKPNSGPGSSRNYGMARAKGDYFIILDSDCILPPRYLETVAESLREDFVHCYGGPDAAHGSFSLVQKAINYAMTAVLTTGGIRGTGNSARKYTLTNAVPAATPSGKGSKSVYGQGGFQPRSFNMGLSKLAYESTGGFGNIHPGEDPDLVFRIWAQGYATRLIPQAFVYHKRRIDWQKFYVQVKKFGMVRPILNRRYPKTAKITYWFPTFFCWGFLTALVFWYWGIVLPLLLYAVYFGLVFVDSLLKNRSLSIGILSLVAVALQFTGYGYGFLKSTIFINFSKKNPEELFPRLFFTNADTETAV
jgi:glycosyltransferase involved in cell wall biosynthesis